MATVEKKSVTDFQKRPTSDSIAWRCVVLKVRTLYKRSCSLNRLLLKSKLLFKDGQTLS